MKVLVKVSVTDCMISFLFRWFYFDSLGVTEEVVKANFPSEGIVHYNSNPVQDQLSPHCAW